MQAGSAIFCRYLEGLLAAEQQESGIPQERVRLLGPPGWSHVMAASTVPPISSFSRQPSCQSSQKLSVPPPSANASQSRLHCVQMVVMGFSQGGAMALLSLRFQAKLAAVLGLSSYLVLAEVCLPLQLQEAVLHVHAHCHPYGLNALAVR